MPIGHVILKIGMPCTFFPLPNYICISLIRPKYMVTGDEMLPETADFEQGGLQQSAHCDFEPYMMMHTLMNAS